MLFWSIKCEYNTKGQMLCDSAFRRYLEEANLWAKRVEATRGLGGGENGELVFDGHRVSVEVN